MGQYYIIANLDKKQYIHPHRFGDGLKLMEFGCSGGTVLCGLALLLADGNGRGGGDFHGAVCDECKTWIECGPPGYGYAPGPGLDRKLAGEKCPKCGGHGWLAPRLVGSWKGDRIVIAGDYADGGQYGFPENGDENIYILASEQWEDVSKSLLEVMRSDPWLRDHSLSIDGDGWGADMRRKTLEGTTEQE